MDEFFQRLREIQKRERSLSGLSSVEDDFYGEVSSYFNRLMKKIDTNPFSFESYLLRDAQRITEEICERREHKIASTAVMNVQRVHQLFKEANGKKTVKKGESITVPINSTPEEEKLYLELVDSLVKYRKNITAPLKSYTRKNPENLIEAQKEPLKTVNGSDVERISSIENAPSNERHSNRGTSSVESSPLDEGKKGNGKVRVESGFDDFSGLGDQIYEIYGSEPSKENSDALEAHKNSKGENSVSTVEDAVSAGSDSSVSLDIQSSNVQDEQKEKYSSTSGVNRLKTGFNGKIETLMIFDELPPIVCVDENVYGPVIPQDIVTMPEPNARILIKNSKCRSIQTYK